VARLRASSLVWLVSAAAAIGAAGWVVLPALVEGRRSAELAPGDPLEDTSPGLALTSTLMGGGRGLAIIALWTRAMAMQEEGRYFELVQLFDLIGRLEPHFPTIWQYASWNLAYNVSVKFTDPEERWRWVSRGIELARDRGIVYNPRSVDIYFEIAWIYFHKVGGVSFDEYSAYYRQRLAADVEDALGRAPDLAAMAAAPEADEVLSEPGVAALVEALRGAGARPLADSVSVTRELGRSADIQAVLSDPAHADALSRLMPLLRREGMWKNWRLSAKRMLELSERFGPIDWRLPEAHSLYWSTRALEVSGEEDWIANADRVTVHSLIGLFRTGRLYFERPEGGEPVYITSPDGRFIDAVNGVYRAAISRFEGESAESSFKDAHRNFLDDAVVLLYTSGEVDRARRYYNLAAVLYPNPDYETNLRDFVVGQIESGVAGQQIDQAQGVVVGYVWQALRCLATGDRERAASLDALAGRAWARYLADYGEGAMVAPTYEQLRREVVRQFLDFVGGNAAEELRSRLPEHMMPD